MLGKEVRERIIQARERGVTVEALSKCYGVGYTYRMCKPNESAG